MFLLSRIVAALQHHVFYPEISKIFRWDQKKAHFSAKVRRRLRRHGSRRASRAPSSSRSRQAQRRRRGTARRAARGGWGRRRRPHRRFVHAPAFSALRSCFVPITFRLLVNRSGIQTPPWKIRAGRPTQIWIIAEITNRVNKKSRKTKINFSFFPAAPAFFALWQNEQRKSRPPPCLMPAIRNFYPHPLAARARDMFILSCKTPMERTIFPCNMM